MNNISCDICMDLIPLVQDGAASEDSAAAVKEHIASCPQCRAMFESQPAAEMQQEKTGEKLKKKLHTFFSLLTLMGMFFGISLLMGDGILYMTVILPVIGVCSYGVEHWKALWKSPLILFGLFTAAHLISVCQGEAWNPLGVLFLGAVILILTDSGALIAGLLHFAFRKEKSK